MGSQVINIHQDLLNQCKRGNSKAQFEIYRLYYKTMYNSSLRIVGLTDVAEDIMQDAFLSAFSKLSSYRGEVSFGAWLKRIVINRSLDYLRKKKVVFEELHENLQIPDEENAEVDSITADEVKSAISSLSDGYRTVLSLILIEGYSHEEAGQVLGIQNVSCRTQYSRARKKLQALLIENRGEKIKEKMYE